MRNSKCNRASVWDKTNSKFNAQVTHSHYTRSAARSLLRSSISNVLSANSSLQESHIPEDRSRSSSILRDLNGNNHAQSTLEVVLFSGDGNANKPLTMDFPDDIRRRCCMPFYLIVCLLLSAVYIYYYTTSSKILMNRVEEDLCKIKEDLEHMKSSVEKGTKTQLATIEMDARRKLDTVEKLLKDMKQEKETADTSSCKSRLFGVKADNTGIRAMVMQLLEEFNADKTGRTDFALESAGGSIVSCSYDTKPYNPSSLITLFGLPLCYMSNGPRSIIQPSVLPGECWAFKGSVGAVTIQLLGPVFITGINVEHIPKSISPTGEIDSAPREFTISAFINGKSQSLGQFVYDINGPTLQYFDVQRLSKSSDQVEFSVLSNYGHPDYTCVYRLRVHGTLDTSGAEC